MKIHDLSPTLSPRTAVWPGDVRLSRETAMAFEEGDHMALSSFRTTVHIGAHADAPSHYDPSGESIERRALARYLGPCQLMSVCVPLGGRIGPEHPPGAVVAPRVLFRTGTFPDPEKFNVDFAALSPALIDHLHAHGVMLVGLDTPSVDLCQDAEMISHKAIARCGMSILEGLVFPDIPDGTYTLIALPLPLEGADASPVRAVLVEGLMDP